MSVHWLLVGCCGMALLYFTGGTGDVLRQRPRFYGVPTTSTISIFCLSSKQHKPSNISWYRVLKYKSEDKSQIKPGERIQFLNRNLTKNAILVLNNVVIEDRGIYYCKTNNSVGPGTEVQVARPVNPDVFLYNSQMKDGLMILQGLLLAGCIAAFLFRHRTLVERKECVYEEPEVDHIYEGLAIETCEGDLYEEISVYAQAEGAEAPWE